MVRLVEKYNAVCAVSYIRIRDLASCIQRLYTSPGVGTSEIGDKCGAAHSSEIVLYWVSTTGSS
jgi:hypothetical protein